MAKDNPANTSLAHDRQAKAAEICRDAYGGPLVIQGKRTKYLPQFPKESNANYNDRLDSSVFYDATARTINGLTGMVFRAPPTLADDLPKQIHELWENIDLAGTHGAVFCQNRHRDGEIDGHFAILVDMQRVRSTPQGLDEERAMRLRPYWVGIKKQDVLAAEYEVINGVPTLVHFRYREKVVKKEDRYTQVEAERVREYDLDGERVLFAVKEKQKGKGSAAEWATIDEGVMDIDEIPVAVAYLGEKVGSFESSPPHLALALENIKHYQLTSDNDNVLHLCAVPIWVRIGYEGEEGQDIGPAVGLDLPNGGDAKYVEPAGNGLGAMERRIEKSEYRMAILGLSLLMSETRQAQTATSKRINKAENDSALSNHARASQDGFEEATRLTAKWMGLEAQMPKRTPDSRWVAVNRDFEDLHLDAPMISALGELVEKKKLSIETLWNALQRAVILDSSFDAALERERIEEEPGEDLDTLRRMVRQLQSTRNGGESGGEGGDE